MLITWQRHKCLVRKEADSEIWIPCPSTSTAVLELAATASKVTLCIPCQINHLQTKLQQVQITGDADTWHSTADRIPSSPHADTLNKA